MPYVTPDIRTAVNRAVLFASLSRSNFPLILSTPDPKQYLVCQNVYWHKHSLNLLADGYLIVINLSPSDLALFASLRTLAQESDSLVTATHAQLNEPGSYPAEIMRSLDAIASEDL